MLYCYWKVFIHQVLTFDLPCLRLSFLLWVLRGVTASSLASTWAVQTPS